jgi:hypothetical protein
MSDLPSPSTRSTTGADAAYKVWLKWVESRDTFQSATKIVRWTLQSATKNTTLFFPNFSKKISNMIKFDIFNVPIKIIRGILIFFYTHVKAPLV